MRKHILVIAFLLRVGLDASAQDYTGSISLTRFDKALQNIRESEMLVYSAGIRGAPAFDMAADAPTGYDRTTR